MATGETANISAREPNAPVGNAQKPGTVGGVVDRAKAAHRAAIKKNAVRKANDTIRARQKGEPSRLKFTKEERADPALSKSIGKADKAADRLDKANSKIPTKKTITAQRVYDKPTGQSKTRLSFRETERPPNGKLMYGTGGASAVVKRPARETSLAIHRQISKAEGENSGVEAAHKSQRAATGAASKVRDGYRSMKLRPYRAAATAEKGAAKANVNALYQKALRNRPDIANASGAKGAVQKAFMKRKIKRDYAKAFRQGNIQTMQKTAATAQKTVKNATQSVQKTVAYVARNWKWFLILGAAVILFALLFGGMSSCGSIMSGGGTTVVATSYSATDDDITNTDADYSALEAQLQAKINNTPNDYPGYDEYRYNLDEIGHDPFELASYLTAKYNDYTEAEVQAELQSLLSQQYTITYTPTTEVRYREETVTETTTDADGNTTTTTTTVEVPYNYYILTVTLVNNSLGAVAAADLTPDQKQMYDVYQLTQGNRPYLFADNPSALNTNNPYADYTIPPDALTNTQFAAMMSVATQFLGYPYVWGGSTPATSFDCSGFVCWVINQSGVGSVGRTTAQGLLNDCTVVSPADAQPGDLVFFQGTYDTAGASHVGIYVGNGMMIAAGNPIQYTNITTSYWTSHFLAYGRLPGMQ